MSSYDVTVPATTNGTISLASTNGAGMVPARSDDTAAGVYTFTKPGNAKPQATATATPDSGYTLTAWSSATSFTAPAGSVLNADPSGNSATCDITDNIDLSAPTFVQYHAVTIITSGTGTVTVATDDAGSQTGPSLTVYVQDGTTLSIGNTPGSGYRYDSTSSSAPITAATTITVTFVLDEDADADVGSTDFIGHDTANKYLLLKVPDYETASSSTFLANKSSLVQIGDATLWGNSASETDGHDLAAFALDQPARVTALASGTVSFLDDIRQRGVDGGHGGTFAGTLATPPSETAARETNKAYSAPGATSAGSARTDQNAKVSAAVPDYVGWRDHTDGHRITTTRGDKIEVIGGNYKIVSLGRGTGVAAYEMSGGIIIDAMEPPGNTTSVTWRDCPTDSPNKGWQVVSQTVKGNEISRYHGTQREEWYGDKKISVTGAPGEPTSGFSLSGASDAEGDVSYVGTHSFNDAHPTKWDQRAGTPPKLQQPAIHESTWASSIKEYTKVSGQVKEETHYNGGFLSHTYMSGVGDAHTDYFHLMGSMGHFEFFFGAKTEFFVGASTTVGLANRFELFVGMEEQLNIGVSMSVHFPNKWDLWASKIQAGLDKVYGGVFDTEAAVKETNAALNSLGAYLRADVAQCSKTEASLCQQLMALKTDL